MSDISDKKSLIDSDALLSMAELFGLELSEDYLESRFERSTQHNQSISYDFTDDTTELQQYYWLRERLFRSLWGMNSFSGAQDPFDSNSHTLIAKRDRQCIGGGRLTVSSMDKPCVLPMEGGHFLMQRLFPELDLHETTYAECSHLAVLPEYSEGDVFLEVIRILTQRAISLGADYIFNVSPVPLARSYRQTITLLGGDMKVCSHIAPPVRKEYEGAQVVLSVLDLTRQVRQYKEHIKATQQNQLSTD